MTNIFQDRREPLPIIALSVPEAAQSIGISERHLRELTSTGEVPHCRLGSRIVYPVEALRGWLNGRTVCCGDRQPSNVEPEAELGSPTETSAVGDWPMTRITAVTPN